MASGDRFYMLSLRHRPALWGDIGNVLQIEGLVVGGEGAQAVLMLPGTPNPASAQLVTLTLEEWTDWLQRSDDPEVLVMPQKAFHRKLRYIISGHVQQKVWRADGLECMYCHRPLGEVQLTIDHFKSLEEGGINDTSNYLSCCRKDNKDKGAMSPQDWCQLKGLDYSALVQYLSTREVK